MEIDQSEQLEEITEFAKKQLNKLDADYNPTNNLDIYYDLDGLNPYNEAQKRQVYSTDPLIHQENKAELTENNFYCNCEKKFHSKAELTTHIKKRNNYETN